MEYERRPNRVLKVPILLLLLFFYFYFGYLINSTAWHSQPYSRGSYTSIGIGGKQSDIEKIAEPLCQKINGRKMVKKINQTFLKYYNELILRLFLVKFY